MDEEVDWGLEDDFDPFADEDVAVKQPQQDEQQSSKSEIAGDETAPTHPEARELYAKRRQRRASRN